MHLYQNNCAGMDVRQGQVLVCTVTLSHRGRQHPPQQNIVLYLLYTETNEDKPAYAVIAQPPNMWLCACLCAHGTHFVVHKVLDWDATVKQPPVQLSTLVPAGEQGLSSSTDRSFLKLNNWTQRQPISIT